MDHLVIFIIVLLVKVLMDVLSNVASWKTSHRVLSSVTASFIILFVSHASFLLSLIGWKSLNSWLSLQLQSTAEFLMAFWDKTRCVYNFFLSPVSVMTWSDWIFDRWDRRKTVGIHYDYKLTSTNDFWTRHWWIITWIFIVWRNMYSNLLAAKSKTNALKSMPHVEFGEKFSVVTFKIFIMGN